VEVEEKDGVYTDADGNTYQLAHESGDFKFVDKLEAEISTDAAKATQAVEELGDVTGDQETAEKIEDEIRELEATEIAEVDGMPVVEPITGDVPASHEGGGASGPPSPEPEAV
jgi:hypothetical protein